MALWLSYKGSQLPQLCCSRRLSISEWDDHGQLRIDFTLFLHTNFYNYMYKDPLARTLQQTKEQLEACREAKHRLEMDWSDKYSAQHLGILSTLKYL